MHASVCEAGDPRFGINSIDRRGEEAGIGVTCGATERDLPPTGDAERRLGAQRAVDELVVRCDERQVDAGAGQHMQRHHRLQARGPATGDQDTKRRAAHHATGYPDRRRRAHDSRSNGVSRGVTMIGQLAARARAVLALPSSTAPTGP